MPIKQYIQRADYDLLKPYLSSWKDATLQTSLLQLPAKKLLKHSNYIYLEQFLNALHIAPKDAKDFKMQLSRFNGTLNEFIESSLQQQTVQTSVVIKKENNEISDRPVQQALQTEKKQITAPVIKPLFQPVSQPVSHKIVVEPKPAPVVSIATDKKSVAPIFCKPPFFKRWHFKRISLKNIHLHFPALSSTAIRQKKLKIEAYKKTFLKKNQKTLRRAAITLPFVSLWFCGYNHILTASAKSYQDQHDFYKTSSVAKYCTENQHSLDSITYTMNDTIQNTVAVTPKTSETLLKTDTVKKARTDTMRRTVTPARQTIAPTRSSQKAQPLIQSAFRRNNITVTPQNIQREYLDTSLRVHKIDSVILPVRLEYQSYAQIRLNTNLYQQTLVEQKDLDLQNFSNLYKQCCYNNFQNLQQGYKNETFKKANKTLKKHGFAKLHPRLYCAGMSMASFCQAADIFKQKYPNSYINQSIEDILKQCHNVHYCTTLRNDLNSSTHNVIKSVNLARDIRTYIQNNDNTIIFGWTPRGGGKYHHQTFFDGNDSLGSYTYCAFNNQHWGNEDTFSNMMSSRSFERQGGYFTDISKSISDGAEKYLLEDVKKYHQQQEYALQHTIDSLQTQQNASIIRDMAWSRV